MRSNPAEGHQKSSQIHFCFSTYGQSDQIGLKLSPYVELHRKQENLISQNLLVRHCRLNTMYTCLSRSSRLHLYVCILGGLVPSKYAGDIELLRGEEKKNWQCLSKQKSDFLFRFLFETATRNTFASTSVCIYATVHVILLHPAGNSIGHQAWSRRAD